VRILGTSPDAIDLAEDRRRFSALLSSLGIPQPESGTAVSLEEAKVVAAVSAIPCSSAPPTCWAGARWRSLRRDPLEGYVREAVSASPEHPVADRPVLEDAFEVDVMRWGRRAGS